MRISFELEANDIARFHAALERAEHLAACMDECDIVETAKEALDRLPIGSAPGYVRQRLVSVQRMILMLEDEAWALPALERTEVLRTLVYFADPDDLIPDDVAVIGLLDDAIMLELLLRRLRHVLDAYDDFCVFCRQQAAAMASDRIATSGVIARRRDALRERMRRRIARAATADNRSANRR
ncbi:MAG: YkvA family protein [Tahibacter sp.]